MTFGVCVCMCVCVCVCVQGISPSITGRILMKLRMDIPVHHAQCVWQTIENRSKVKVKVTENTKTTIWAITFEPEVVETSGWFQNVPCQNIYQKCRSPHDAWRSVFASHDAWNFNKGFALLVKGITIIKPNMRQIVKSSNRHDVK